ncbi:fasciclin domain-containing protein [Galbibacter mesophilus]|uniref:fasciclin domain-containing protein n=1 Tax=Galbibacter mesophilus TaxID=379069 RepID=UPI00191EF23A|nr:fasciclin domain-containing protein [Galbibacter mesophilus]MCM5661384.1 fasciclin domain-containing protein [Galbibacter mesophilus]
MKTITHLKKVALLALMVVGAVACSDDDDNMTPTPNPELSITETAAADSELTILVAALTRTGLDATLNQDGTFTVLAPTNAAFEAAGITNVDAVDEDVLENILLNHVFGEVMLSGDLSTSYKSTLAMGPNETMISMFINTEGVVEFNGVASPTTVDINATNGVIHKVDAVLREPTVTGHAVANPEFSILVEALERFGDQYTGILSGTEGSPFTVFAPTNDAFADLLDMLGAESLADIDDATLEAVLTYHVVSGANATSGALTDGQMVETVLGEELTVSKTDGGVQIMDATEVDANVVAADVQGINGVVHAIDKVLLPQVVLDALNPTVAGFVSMSDDYSSLLAAVQKAGLVDALSAEDAELTVFAPNNEAFATFLSDNSFASLDDVPTDLLTQVLLNHVIDGKIMSGDLSTMYGSTMATNADGDNLSIYINTESGVMLNGVSTVTAADIEVSNGVIHAVDAVIGLPTVVTFATADANFSSLVGALTDADTDFVSVLSGTTDSPFTVFAPTNDAFAKLPSVPAEPTLSAVLSHHVVANSNVRSGDLTDGAMVMSLEGDNITVSLPGTGENIADLTDGAGNTGIGVIAVDVQATNGVIHAIDTVLIPDTTN